MSKYLTREQVIADFKINILPSLKKMIGDDFNEINYYFDLNLEGLLKDKSISDKQRNKWKLKKEDIV